MIDAGRHESLPSFLRDSPRLREVAKGAARTYRGLRPIPVDPESSRNAFYAMCCRCDWQREENNSGRALDVAMAHARGAHGDAFAGFVRVEAR